MKIDQIPSEFPLGLEPPFEKGTILLDLNVLCWKMCFYRFWGKPLEYVISEYGQNESYIG